MYLLFVKLLSRSSPYGTGNWQASALIIMINIWIILNKIDKMRLITVLLFLVDFSWVYLHPKCWKYQHPIVIMVMAKLWIQMMLNIHSTVLHFLYYHLSATNNWESELINLPNHLKNQTINNAYFIVYLLLKKLQNQY